MTSFDSSEKDKPGEEPDFPETKSVASENLSSAGKQYRRIGPYRIEKEIGKGGMGIVLLATQEEPVRRQVALKVIRPEISSDEFLTRFNTERQVLAVMNHPNVARILDAGKTTNGQPYFAMEYVDGMPLNKYCDGHCVSIGERLNLFIDVCSAIQHAHQKGIIHRDLKPGNILVSDQDGKATVKVIDFGIAKAFQGSDRLIEQSLFTEIGQILGTYKYMSPEQADLKNLDIDTRTDVYALGVILYELLTGSTPLDKSTIKGMVDLRILELIREMEPLKPSRQLKNSSVSDISTITDKRQTDSNRLNRILTGDLDWIVMKALEKEPSRRYDSVARFVDDIRRFQNDEPVTARPPSFSYRVIKFVRKRRSAVVAATLLFVALLLGMAGTTWGLFRAQRSEQDAISAREQAEDREQLAISAVRRFGDVITNNPELKNNSNLGGLRKLLLREPLKFFRDLEQRLQMNIDTQPLSKARLAIVAFDLGVITDEIGDKKESLNWYQQALAIQKQLVDERPLVTKSRRDLTDTFMNLGSVKRDLGELEDAMHLYEQALTLQKNLVQNHPSSLSYKQKLASIHVNIGVLLREMEKKGQALEAMREALLIQENIVNEAPTTGELRSQLATIRCNIGLFLSEMGERKEALESYEVALSIREQLVQDFSTSEYQNELASSHYNIGVLLAVTEKKQEATEAYYRALEIQKKLVVEYPSVTQFQILLAECHNAIGGPTFSRIGKVKKSLEAHRRSLTLFEQLAKTNSDVTEIQESIGDCYYNIGCLLHDSGEADKAGIAYQGALLVQERLVRENPSVADFARKLGLCLNNIALIDMDERNFLKAIERLQLAISHQETALMLWPENQTYRPILLQQLENLQFAAAGLNDQQLVDNTWLKLIEIARTDPQSKHLERCLVLIQNDISVLDIEETIELASHAYDTGRFVLAARMWGEVIERDPNLAIDRMAEHPYSAACAAAIAGNGGEIDAPKPDKAAMKKLRMQANRWLGEELQHSHDFLGSSNENDMEEANSLVMETLIHWKEDPDLMKVRGDNISDLPDAEQVLWQDLWKHVDELLKEVSQ